MCEVIVVDGLGVFFGEQGVSLAYLKSSLLLVCLVVYQ